MIGIIGGSGVYEITQKADSCSKKVVKTDYGEVTVSILEIFSKKIAFIPRHAQGHSIPPHKINYRANIDALRNVGVTQIIATNSVGSMNIDMAPGSFVVPNDFLDFTQNRIKTFYEDKVVHVDVTEPYCPNLRDILDRSGDVILGGTYVCTEGPRFETPAEIKMFKMLGGDLVGMTGVPEVTLARERGICYNSICIVSNYAAGISSNTLTIDEVFDIVSEKEHDLLELIYNFIKNAEDSPNCECHHALNGAEV
ncbi:5'-methylthioadenosine phosphorylase [Methanobrevibacter gottschalkii]|uniref:Probable S-methyl-5'-thioinosine phosphorylase n=2 Tax=Methanobrevibacter gottschalkii TaxID=190974 RepID=A0A3N5B6R3_9EURY|nr:MULTISPECIES: S-methyl-5'-thioadenosine phosphorylase [Methanobrevibacter]MCQ2971319.1 S-methyl-5'-thioadenosine phosphorylase [archaeon]OEC99187.1 methylthioadenosine phosphorylase [Methanobrevibacter sp. A27]RPF53053.1 5'-methylthioadenosine phosphorylase [Methanobrevibacter gottschalkii DSM 11977]SEK55753.1 5'-methylthioadenosine phosphorylase [Methanobrevibacter gottschalkii]